MENLSVFLTFLICFSLSIAIMALVYKYQKSISPVNQNVINELSFVCIYFLGFINLTQVTTFRRLLRKEPQTIFVLRDLVSFGGLLLALLILGWQFSLGSTLGSLISLKEKHFRNAFFASVIMLILTANSISILRFLIVLQVCRDSYVHLHFQCMVLDKGQSSNRCWSWAVLLCDCCIQFGSNPLLDNPWCFCFNLKRYIIYVLPKYG